MAPILWFGLGALSMNLFTESKERREALGHQQHTAATAVDVGVNCQSFETVNTERPPLQPALSLRRPGALHRRVGVLRFRLR